MITIERTEDAEFVRSVMTHPRIWSHVTDDTAGDPEDFETPFAPSIHYLVPHLDGRPMGVFVVHPHSAVLWEWHIALLPEFWGPAGHLAGAEVIRWIFRETGARKLIGQPPVTNRAAYRYCKRLGFADEGRLTACFLKGGHLIDQHILGIGG